MQQLFLFLTQAEGGAPGYLSRLGEDAVRNLSENIEGFLRELGFDLASGLAERVRTLGDQAQIDPVAKPGQQRAAVQFSMSVAPDLLLLSGEHIRSRNTAEGLASSLALPVIVDSRLDRHGEQEPRVGTLGDALRDLHTNWLPEDQHPRLVFVVTSQAALAEWLETLNLDEEKVREVSQMIVEKSEEDRVPVVLTMGFEKSAGPGELRQSRWILG